MQLLQFLILISFTVSLQADSEGKKFEWKLEKDDVLELNEFHNVRFRVGSQEVLRQDKNRISLIAEDCTPKSCRIYGHFDTYTRYGDGRGPFRKDKTYESKFFIEGNGQYTVPDEYAVPNLRSIPSFPEKKLQTKDKWFMPAEESFDFNSGRFKFSVKASYTLLGVGEWRWGRHSGRGEKIQYSYPIYHENKNAHPGLPVKVYGFATGMIYFDPDKGLPQFKENKLTYTFLYRDGRVTEASFHIHGIYHHRKSLTELAKDNLKDRIQEDLGIPSGDGEKPSNSIDVRKTKEGISISLDSILFDTDSYNLKESAIEKLGEIAKVLKKYPDREIRISGHTDNKGNSDYNQKLSENRAKSVLDRFVKQYDLDSGRLSYQGFGETKPIAENQTEEGRKRNRRVDITIVLE